MRLRFVDTTDWVWFTWWNLSPYGFLTLMSFSRLPRIFCSWEREVILEKSKICRNSVGSIGATQLMPNFIRKTFLTPSERWFQYIWKKIAPKLKAKISTKKIEKKLSDISKKVQVLGNIQDFPLTSPFNSLFFRIDVLVPANCHLASFRNL